MIMLQCYIHSNKNVTWWWSLNFIQSKLMPFDLIIPSICDYETVYKLLTYYPVSKLFNILFNYFTVKHLSLMYLFLISTYIEYIVIWMNVFKYHRDITIHTISLQFRGMGVWSISWDGLLYCLTLNNNYSLQNQYDWECFMIKYHNHSIATH